MRASDFKSSKPGDLIRNLNGDLCFVPHPLPGRIHWTGELMTALSAADRAVGRLAGIGQRLPNPALLVRSFLRREAELSSRIEGTQAGLKDMALFDQTQSAEQRAPDVREVDNNFRALEWGLSQVRHRPLSLGLLRQMHQILMRGVRGEEKTPGQFRTVQAHIGRSADIADARFVPAPPHAIAPAMEELERYIRADETLPPLVRVAMIHYQFEAIHPFADGNGRIGRVLILLLLCAQKVLPVPLLNPSAFLERRREEYYARLLAVSQRGDWNAWIMFFAHGLAAEASDAMRRAEELDRLRTDYQGRVRTARASALLPKLVDQLFVNPAITTGRAVELLGVRFTSAQKAVDRLVREGIVKELTGQKRNRIYLASEIIDVTEGKKAGRLKSASKPRMSKSE